MAILDQFILFGDSITQEANDQSRGFALAAALQAAYIRRLDVINRGFAGYNTDHGLELISEVLPSPNQARIRFLTIFFGANDANTDPSAGQHVPLERFKTNLLSIISHPAILAHSPLRIILITPPPVEENILIQRMKEFGILQEPRRQGVTATYAEAVRSIGQELDIAVLDIWTTFMTSAGWKVGDSILAGSEQSGRNPVLANLLYDGLHLSPCGYRILFDELMKTIEKSWPDQTPAELPPAVRCKWEIGLQTPGP